MPLARYEDDVPLPSEHGRRAYRLGSVGDGECAGEFLGAKPGLHLLNDGLGAFAAGIVRGQQEAVTAQCSLVSHDRTLPSVTIAPTAYDTEHLGALTLDLVDRL